MVLSHFYLQPQTFYAIILKIVKYFIGRAYRPYIRNAFALRITFGARKGANPP